MEDVLKNFLYTGVGIVALTAEKIQKSVDKMIAEGKLSMEEGKKLIDKLVKEGKMSAEEGKKVIEDFVNKGKMSTEDGKKAIDEFIKNAKTKRDELETQVKGIVDRIMSSLDYATAKEVNELKKRVSALEAKLKAVSTPKPVTKTTTTVAKRPAVKPEKTDETA